MMSLRYLLPVILLCTGVDNPRSPEGTDNYGLAVQSMPCQDENIPRYKARRVTNAPVIDGRLNEDVWMRATRSPRFVDLVHGTPTHLDTRAAVMWDDQYLYVGYWIEEPDVRATLTKRDAPIYKDNDAELFIAGRDGYYEFEINGF
ncbi:MAG: carbohydrate-binding family 9-like protein, partial [Cyclobacteriaceae bacterium]